MKKFFMIAVLAVAALTANAQKGEYYVTPKVDLGYSLFSEEGELAIHGGLFGDIGVDFEYMLADQFGLSGGVDFKYFESDKVNSAKFKASYLEFPILANYHMGKFALKAGVKPAIKTSFKFDVADGLASADLNIANSFLVYVPVGASYEIGSTILGLNVDIPCTKALKEGFKMMPIYLSIGYRF